MGGKRTSPSYHGQYNLSWPVDAAFKPSMPTVLLTHADPALNSHSKGNGNLYMQTRAALLLQLLRIVNGSSAVRLPVVEALVAALNGNSLGLKGHTTDLALQQQIADALAGMQFS